MTDLKLMQDYFWILENCEDPDVKFTESPPEKEFASMWLSKLCNDIYWGVDAKQLRNQYLAELSACIDNGKLSKMFMRPPPRGPLPPYQGASNIKLDHKAIVAEMQADAAECIPIVSPRNYQTHMSTKIFDDNRGACAYLAVSLGDPKQGSIWMQMGTNNPFTQKNQEKPTKPSTEQQQQQQHQQQQQQQQCGHYACQRNNNRQQTEGGHDCSNDDEGGNNLNVSFGQFCLDAIAQELAGIASPGDCPVLEVQLKKYAEFIKNYAIGEEAKGLTGIKLRNFLLLNLQTDLIQALETCQ